MRTPTGEQRNILESDARIRLVRAGPGSGKTWLVAEIIRREFASWKNTQGGIAALSFTRVGGDEIRRAVHHELGHPHYVGTIDAFLFRYVVRPFFSKAYSAVEAPRLIPADWLPGSWVKGRNGIPFICRIDDRNYNLFDICYIGRSGDRAVLARRSEYRGGLELVPDDHHEAIRHAKQRIWRELGWLTHADSCLVSYNLLTHREYGIRIRSELARRFPCLVVDELQDTGFYLGKCITCLIEEESIRGVLVGDPDQAIYEFNGAKPSLFSEFEAVTGTVGYAITRSRRCSPAVATAASHLMESGGTLQPNVERTGSAIMVRYGSFPVDPMRLIEHAEDGGRCVKAVTRKTASIQKLTRRQVAKGPKLGCPALNHVLRAVTLFRQGRTTGALAATETALALSIFDQERLTPAETQASGIEPIAWKRLAIHVLLRANEVGTGITLYDWQVSVGCILKHDIETFIASAGISAKVGAIKPKKRRGFDSPCSQFIPNNCPRAHRTSVIPILTVHGVKGETHDVTIFVCPPEKPARCPSVVWWSSADKDLEERRIAYVAMTRTRGDLVLCVEDSCYERLVETRPEFVACFKVVTLDEYFRI